MEYQRFLLHLTSDEETSLKPMIPMKHGEVDSALAEKLKAVHGKVPPVFLLPGLEGIASVMEPLAKNINYPSIGLQFPYNDACNASIRGITEKLLQVYIYI